jgi:hypothetical protein
MKTAPSPPSREFLRHTLAVVAYRGAKVLRGAPAGFGAFSVGETTRSPSEILAHLGDLLDWALALAKGSHVWRDSVPGGWSEDVGRFFECLARLDEYIASGAPLGFPPEKLFQGPIADALAHVGQLAMLRRLAGSPVRGENYFKADIEAGRVGPDQSPPRREFE